MEIRRVSDLFVAVLFALAIHGGIAVMRVSLPPVTPNALPVVESPLKVRLVAAMFEEPKKDKSIAIEKRNAAPVGEKHEEIMAVSPVTPDVNARMVEDVPLKKDNTSILPSLPDYKKAKIPIDKKPEVIKSSSKHASKMPVETTNPATKYLLMEEKQEIADYAPEGHAKAKVSKAEPKIVMAVPMYRDNQSPPYPPVARRRGYEGLVILSVMVRADGTVDNVRVKTSSGKKILDRAAMKGVRAWLFEPASRDGIPIDMGVDVPIRFVLKEK